jgi:tetratricopeptide (TPR) repeat protein
MKYRNLSTAALVTYLVAALLVLPTTAANRRSKVAPPADVDTSISDKLKNSNQNNDADFWKSKIQAVDKSTINKTLYNHVFAQMVLCGYSTNESSVIASEYVRNTKTWDQKIDTIRLTGAAPFHIQHDLAFWETVRSHCLESEKTNLNFEISSEKILSRSKKHDRLLSNNILALSALQNGEIDKARMLFEANVKTLGGVNAEDPSARKARNVFYSENRKNFKGEPFERTMAYFYRGIIYWIDGDLDNARACFRSGLVEDAKSEDEIHKADYVLLSYLDGFLNQRIGGDGNDIYQRTLALANLSLPTNRIELAPYDKLGNVQLFVEFGAGPEKVAEGNFKEFLRINQKRQSVHSATISIGEEKITCKPIDSIGFQATTRGGRAMDGILKNKVVFKNTSANIGGAAMTGAVIAANVDNGAPVAAALIILSGAAYGLSYLANPACDTRTWWNLPQYLSFASVTLPKGHHRGKVDFYRENGELIPEISKILDFKIEDASKDLVLFISDKKCFSGQP